MSTVLEPDAVWPGENYFVCLKNRHGEEKIVQSELTAERAEQSVDHLNEHERQNARSPRYFWRTKLPGEIIPTGRKAY